MKTRSKTLIHQAGATLFLWLFIAFASMAQEGGLSRSSTKSDPNRFVINEGSVKIDEAGDYSIEGTGVPTGNTITVELKNKDAVATITLDDVNIEFGDCPFNIIRGTVHLILEGDNGNFLVALPGNAGLHVSEESKLIIKEASKGMLTAKGRDHAVGIGGGGDITINGGSVEAIGGDYAAGIGEGGDITINGGYVTAIGGDYAAGITGNSITINGGSVEATGGDVGIGMASTCKISGGTIVCSSLSSNFVITGGSVRARDNIVMNDGKEMAVVKGLPENGQVTSIRIDGVASYGLKDVLIDDKGLLYLYIPKGKPVPVSIGIDNKSYTGYAVTSDIYDDANPATNASYMREANSPTRVLTRDQNGGTIEFKGGGWNDTPGVGDAVTLKVKSNSCLNRDELNEIKGLEVKFVGDEDGQLTYNISFTMPDRDVLISLFDKLSVETEDGEYTQTFNKLTITSARTYKLKGASAFLSDKEKASLDLSNYISNFYIDIANNIDVTLHLDGVSIKPTSSFALSCGDNSNVTIILDGDNYLEGVMEFAALRKGASDGMLTIKGTGRLVAQGGELSAGIGGSALQSTNNITIEGGTIVAIGGVDASAGIGSGLYASAAEDISITGGSVNATVQGITDKLCTLITFPVESDVKEVKEASGLSGYNIKNMNLYPEDGSATLYLWLPKDSHQYININGYRGVVEAGKSATLAKTIIIEKDVSYDSAHNGESITINPGITFTIDTEGASVSDLTIMPGGKLVIKKELKVDGTFYMERSFRDGAWHTFCSPVPLRILNKLGKDIFVRSGYTKTNDQKWAPLDTPELTADTPYLLALSEMRTTASFLASDVTFPGRKSIVVAEPDQSDNILLFKANPSLTEQTLNNIYVLEDYQEGKAFVLKDEHILKPFEAYIEASPAMKAQFKSFSLSDSSNELPTSIAQVINNDFKAWSDNPGTLSFEVCNKPGEVMVLNASGKLFYASLCFEGRKQLHGLPAGIYLVRCNKVVKKVIVK